MCRGCCCEVHVVIIIEWTINILIFLNYVLLFIQHLQVMHCTQSVGFWIFGTYFISPMIVDCNHYIMIKCYYNMRNMPS